MTKKYTHEDLVARLKSPGWRLNTGQRDKTAPGTLEDLVRTTHRRKAEKETPGLIEQIETTIELDMLQIEKLWHELGLPTI
jgi:hypothetical protein